MKTGFIPFQIGEQYENWEFDLEPDFDSKHPEKYRYIKNDILTLFDIPIHEIFLYFNLDILYRVEYHFYIKVFEKLKAKLIEFLTPSTFKDFGDRLEWENGNIYMLLTIKKTIILSVIDIKYLDY